MMLSLLATLSLMVASVSINSTEAQPVTDTAATAMQKRTHSFTGSLETNSILYQNDPVIGLPGGTWGSNNYLKLNWNTGLLSLGLQAEWYPKVLAGYPEELSGAGITGLWVDWKKGPWHLTGGSFHEQLGSGIALRTWEDRDMGINNALFGIRAGWRSKAFSAKVFGGLPKWGVWPTLATGVAAVDISTDIFALGKKASAHSLLLEASIVDRISFSQDPGIALLASSSGFSVPTQVFTWSLRAGYAWRGLTVKGEYVGKSADFYAEALPGSREQYRLKSGNAQIVELGYANGGFSGTLTLRRLENMSSPVFHTSGNASIANTLNYLPSLCAQQTYLLAGLNPYVTLAEGEMGFQGDLYYTFRRGTWLGGRYGMKLHVGGSWLMGLPCALPNRDVPHLAYRDINIDLERRWSRNFRTTLFVTIQENSPTHGDRKATNAQNVFVIDGLYRISRAMSIRLELQYLYSEELTKDWMAAVLEFGFAPHWSFSVSDMYNHGSTGVHYYHLGVNYTLSSFSISLTAGRNREGMICSSGVCRWQPAWSGVGLRLQWTI